MHVWRLKILACAWSAAGRSTSSQSSPTTVLWPLRSCHPGISLYQARPYTSPESLPLDAEVTAPLRTLLAFSRPWADQKEFFAFCTSLNINQKTKDRAAAFINGGNVRLVELKELEDKSVIVLLRIRASCKDASYYAGLHCSPEGAILGHSCTCAFAGRANQKRTKELLTELRDVLDSLAQGHYVEVVQAPDEAWVRRATIPQLRPELVARKMPVSGKIEDLRFRLLHPELPESYGRKKGLPLHERN